jgi:hypothetical protein
MTPWVCPACGLVAENEVERILHEAGKDERHPSCPHQDIEAIVANQVSSRDSLFGKAWG